MLIIVSPSLAVIFSQYDYGAEAGYSKLPVRGVYLS